MADSVDDDSKEEHQKMQELRVDSIKSKDYNPRNCRLQYRIVNDCQNKEEKPVDDIGYSVDGLKEIKNTFPGLLYFDMGAVPIAEFLKKEGGEACNAGNMDKGKECYELATWFIQNNYSEEAVKLRRALRINMSKVLCNEKNYGEAYKLATQVIEKDNKDIAQLLNRALSNGFALRSRHIIKNQQMKREEVIKLREKVLENAKKMKGIMDQVPLATCLKEQGNKAYDVGDLEQAKEFYELATWFIQNDDSEKAAKERQAIQIKMNLFNPDEVQLSLATGFKQQGNKAYDAGDMDKAKEFYELAINYLDFNGNEEKIKLWRALRLNISKVLCNEKKYEEAIESATMVIERDVNDIKALYRRATAYFKSNNLHEAVNDLNKSHALDGKNKDVNKFRIRVQKLLMLRKEEDEGRT